MPQPILQAHSNQIRCNEAEANIVTGNIINNNNIPNISSRVPPHLDELPQDHKNMLTGDWYRLSVPGNGACLTNSIAAFWFEDDRRGPEVRKMANQFMLSTWWFWEPMLVFPMTIKIGSNGHGGHVSKTFDSSIQYQKFLSSDESSYMYAASSVDNAILSNMLNLNIYTFTFNWQNGASPSWSMTSPDQLLKIYRMEYNHRYPLDVALYNNDASIHYDLLIDCSHPVYSKGTVQMREIQEQILRDMEVLGETPSQTVTETHNETPTPI